MLRVLDASQKDFFFGVGPINLKQFFSKDGHLYQTASNSISVFASFLKATFADTTCMHITISVNCCINCSNKCGALPSL